MGWPLSIKYMVSFQSKLQFLSIIIAPKLRDILQSRIKRLTSCPDCELFLYLLSFNSALFYFLSVCFLSFLFLIFFVLALFCFSSFLFLLLFVFALFIDFLFALFLLTTRVQKVTFYVYNSTSFSASNSFSASTSFSASN